MKTKSWLLAALWAASVVYGVTILFQSVTSGGIYSIWSDRDLLRSLNFFSNPQFFGAEFTAGGRVPGATYYLVLALIHQLKLHAENILWVLNLSYLVSALILSFSVYRTFGRAAAATTTIFLIASPLAGQHLTQVWNPSVAMTFGNIYFALLLPMLVFRRANYLPWVTLVAGMAMQIHLTYSTFLIFTLFSAWMARVPVKRKHALMAVAILIALYLPTIYNEATNHFAITRDWLYKRHPLFRTIQINQHYTAITPFKFLMGTTLVTRDWHTWGALGPTILFLIALFWMATEGRKKEPVLCSFVVMVLFGMIPLLAYSQQFQARYGLFLWPMASCIAGITFARLWDLKIRRFTQPALVLLLAAWIYDAAQWTPGDTPLRPKNFRAVVDTLRNQFGWTQNDVATRVTLLQENPFPRKERWLTPQEGMRSIDFINREPSLPRSTPLTDCALVLLRGRPGDLPEDEILKAASIIPEPLTFTNVVRRPEAAYAFYRPVQGNCLRNMANPYFPDPTPIAPSKVRYELHLYQVDQPNPLKVHLDLHLDGKEAWATVSSNQLRGYDGIQDFLLRSGNVRFRNLATDQFIQLSLSNHDIGSEYFFSPWKTDKIPLTRGDYLVSFSRYGNGFSRIGFLKASQFPDDISRMP